jgi:metal-responsive CopG/Arc/MetJ family transcriptional regulator
LVEKIDAQREDGQSRSALVRDLVERALEEPAA